MEESHGSDKQRDTDIFTLNAIYESRNTIEY